MTRDIRRLSSPDHRIDAICRALEPYPWRAFTAAKVGRLALEALGGAVDVTDGGSPLPGCSDLRDERAAVLADLLSSCAWRDWTLKAVSHHMVAELESWWGRRQWLEEELIRVLG